VEKILCIERKNKADIILPQRAQRFTQREDKERGENDREQCVSDG